MDGARGVAPSPDKPAGGQATAAISRGGEYVRGSSGIFGRDHELARVSDFLKDIPQGPHALLLEGEAGVGKTTVWQWGLEQARNLAYRVLPCRPAEAEAKLSYAGVADLLEGVGEDVWSALPLTQRRALDIALLRDDAQGFKLDPRLVGAALVGSLRAIARSTPTLIAIDDVQWLDLPSARVLQFAIRRLQVEPVGVVITLRTPHSGDLPLGLDRGVPAERLLRLELGPFTLGALHHVVRSRWAVELPRSLLIQLHQISGGNPFYALQIAHELVEQGLGPEAGAMPIPGNLRELVERRLSRLPRHGQEVLLIVAALSHPTLSLVAAASDHPEAVKADIDRAARLGLVEVEGDRIRFVHPLLASVHYSSASTSLRQALHSRLAKIVADVEERARHLALSTSGPDAAVANELEQAAGRARARGAPEAAAALLEEGCRLTPPDQADALWRQTSEAAMCHYLAGNAERARSLWEQVERSAPPGPARAAALWHLAEFRYSTDINELASDALLEAGDDARLKAAIHHTQALSLAYAGQVSQALAHARSALELAQAQTDSATVAMAHTAAMWVEFAAGLGVSPGDIDRALELEWATRDLPLENSPRIFRALILWHVGEAPAVVRKDLDDLRRQAIDSGLDVSLPLLLFLMSDHECRSGDWELAERYASECIEAGARSEQAYRAPLGRLAMALLDARRGLLEQAHKTAAEALAMAEKTGPRLVIALIWGVLGYIDLARGDPKAAYGWLEQVAGLETADGFGEPTILRSVDHQIEALIELGQLDQAEELVQRLESRGHSLDRAWALAMAARCRGLLAAARGDLAEAQVALEQALIHHQRLAEPFELGRTLLALGNLQRRRRQKQAARMTLERARSIFEGLGAAGLAARAAEEIRRTGERVAGSALLSATEERVARLVAEGRTNREIAAALFMSVKAVEANLTRIYAKLELRSRTELAVRMGGRAQ